MIPERVVVGSFQSAPARPPMGAGAPARVVARTGAAAAVCFWRIVPYLPIRRVQARSWTGQHQPSPIPLARPAHEPDNASGKGGTPPQDPLAMNIGRDCRAGAAP